MRALITSSEAIELLGCTASQFKNYSRTRGENFLIGLIPVMRARGRGNMNLYDKKEVLLISEFLNARRALAGIKKK